MKNIISAVAVAALLSLGGGIVSSDTAEAQGKRYYKGGHSGGHYVHRRSNTGRNVAIGVGAAILGTIILNEAARASSSEGLSCGQLARRCDNGADWACRRFDRAGC